MRARSDKLVERIEGASDLTADMMGKLPDAWRLPSRVGDGLAMVVEASPAGLVELVAAGLPDCVSTAACVVVAEVTYPIASCRLMDLYYVRTFGNSASSSAASVMVSRCGHSVLIWPTKDSIQPDRRVAGAAVVLDEGHQRHERGRSV